MRTLIRNTMMSLAFMSVMALPEKLHACAVCFGDVSSPLVQGAKYGVLFLAGVIYVLLFAMVGIVFYWFKRAQALEAKEEGEPEAS